ncbi:MAG: hypothetical protein ABIG95_05495 [Candidatus Woesearchaeota archaeon]
MTENVIAVDSASNGVRFHVWSADTGLSYYDLPDSAGTKPVGLAVGNKKVAVSLTQDGLVQVRVYKVPSFNEVSLSQGKRFTGTIDQIAMAGERLYFRDASTGIIYIISDFPFMRTESSIPPTFGLIHCVSPEYVVTRPLPGQGLENKLCLISADGARYYTDVTDLEQGEQLLSGACIVDGYLIIQTQDPDGEYRLRQYQINFGREFKAEIYPGFPVLEMHGLDSMLYTLNSFTSDGDHTVMRVVGKNVRQHLSLFEWSDRITGVKSYNGIMRVSKGLVVARITVEGEEPVRVFARGNLEEIAKMPGLFARVIEY